MNPKIRKGVMGAVILLLLGSIGMSVWWFLQPSEQETEVAVYSCQQAAGLDYQVYFVPNQFFPEVSAGPGLGYLNSLVDYIDTHFTYKCIGEAPAEISGDYQVTAALTGYLLKNKPNSTSFEKEKIKIWEKTEVLVPATPFSVQDTNCILEGQIPVDFNSYTDFVDSLREEFRYTADEIDLTVAYKVNAKIKTADGEITETMAPTMLIVMEGDAFTVDGQLTDQKDGKITKPQMETVPGMQTKRIEYAAGAGVFLLLLLGLIFGTAAETIGPAEADLRRIVKKYGDWIVNGRGKIPALFSEKFLAMESFEDLIKVADEVGQPVLYENHLEGIHSFYVLGEALNYSYTLLEKQADEDTLENTPTVDGNVEL